MYDFLYCINLEVRGLLLSPAEAYFEMNLIMYRLQL